MRVLTHFAVVDVCHPAGAASARHAVRAGPGRLAKLSVVRKHHFTGPFGWKQQG